ncbi:MAG TPA: hypothetical protein VLW84_05665 [Terriglobales bacterium]|nr:hypothetical protein [Terriglobales bacterium]
MKADGLVKSLLVLIAIFLGIIALGPLLALAPVHAQSEMYPLYFEPGTTMLRAPDNAQQVVGKVAIDLRTGKIWGFPTLTQQPYPIDVAKSIPPTSHPFLLGKFALADTDK